MTFADSPLPWTNFYLSSPRCLIFKVRLLGSDLGLPAELIHRHPFPGPGLAIRIICQEEPYMEKDFPETQVLCRLVVNYKDMVEKVSSTAETVRNTLKRRFSLAFDLHQ